MMTMGWMRTLYGVLSKLRLPTVPYFPGRPAYVFQSLCPASRLESSRDARCPVFWPLHSFCFEYVYSYWIPIQSKSVWPQLLVASRSYDEFWGTLKRIWRCFCSAFCPRKQCILLSGFSLWWTLNRQLRGQIRTYKLQICSEFYSYVLSDSKPLNAAASGKKCYWRMSFDPEAYTSGQTDWMRFIRPTEGWTCSRKSRVCPSLVSLDLFYVCTEVQFVL